MGTSDGIRGSSTADQTLRGSSCRAVARWLACEAYSLRAKGRRAEEQGHTRLKPSQSSRSLGSCRSAAGRAKLSGNLLREGCGCVLDMDRFRSKLKRFSATSAQPAAFASRCARLALAPIAGLRDNLETTRTRDMHWIGADSCADLHYVECHVLSTFSQTAGQLPRYPAVKQAGINALPNLCWKRYPPSIWLSISLCLLHRLLAHSPSN